MGASQSINDTKSPTISESHKSARNVLERYAESIKQQAENDASGYEKELKGKLEEASFCGAYCKWIGVDKYDSTDPCYLDHTWHTNLLHDKVKDRDPCDGRNQKRFDENEGFECGNDKIIGNSDKYGSCAPPRRRHICDKNLEALTVANTKNSNDLIGNISVTAKYEGASIVAKHPHKETSEVCTALARSFADIGDIVRGIDMFKPNVHDKVETGLREVFKKIHENLRGPAKNYYADDGSGNYYKLRDDWWKANRDQVWQAITCAAPPKSGYFMQLEKSEQIFSNEHCGHKQGSVTTNLDYVPQFLRWFNEWAEEFCRKKKDKLKKIKEDCRGDNNDRYCDGDGFDCTQTDISSNILFVDLKCPSCANSCKSYKQWLKKKEGEFNKQKEKYEKEINDVRSNSHSTYDKEFYNKLKTEYSSFKTFAATLKEVLYCNDNNVHKKLDFNIPNVTFSNSDYCSSCPVFGVQCEGGNCSNVIIKECTDIMLRDTKGIKNKREVININMLVSDNSANGIAKELKDFCENTNIFKGIRNDEWSCGYLCNLDVCDLTNDNKNLHIDKRVTIRVVFKRWLEYFLKDYNRINENLNQCINNVEQNTCINECKKKCACIEKWAELKLKEWECVRNRYYSRYKKDYSDIYHFVRTFLKDEQFQTDLKKAKAWFKELRDLEDSSKCTDPDPSGNKECKQKDVVESLLYQLQKKIKTCQEQREENGKKDCMDMPKSPNEDDDLDDEEDEDEELHTTKNPCVTGGDVAGVGKIRSVRDVAENMEREVQTQLYGNKGESALKGDIKKAQFKNGANPNKLDGGKICKINTTHSNDSRRRRDRRGYKGPCTGKDGGNNGVRMKIGTTWHTGSEVKMSAEHIYMPPRRQHMCTSNLENIDVQRVIGYSNVNDSFLGDVLLAAKMDAAEIIKRYKNQNNIQDVTDPNYQETVCRAIRYGFADLGDIIKGTDLWEANPGEKKTQRNLETIFGKIKAQLKGELNSKYDSDKDDKKYINLRKDWWEANRYQVWNAMKCATRKHQISCPGMPVDDYIPQRLRWMTEWAEWYCKKQSQEYDKLKQDCTGCTQCKNKGGGKQCMNDDNECKTCKEACAKYKAKIEKWENQWKLISKKYEELYKKALLSTAAVSKNVQKSTPDKDQHVIEFLKQLQQQNDVTTSGDKSDVYGTAEGYVHQEAAMDCEKQTQFCKNKNGVKKPNGAEDVNYTFKDTPNGYDVVCKCKDRPEQQIKKKEVEDACKIAQDIFKGKGENTTVGQCKKKDFGGNSYPDWQCDENSKLVTGNGECMPPRRQKLCIHFLAHKNERPNIKTQNNLREAFIKSAAAETFFSWYYFKKINDKSNKLDEKLKEGEIPPQFLRSMFYTFADYRDICLDTDISKKQGPVNDAKNKIDEIFRNIDGKTDEKKREEFWKENGKEIWEGMVCALTHVLSGNDKETARTKLTTNYPYNNVKFSGGDSNSPTLEKFAETPQFFRWMIEWGEDFCVQRGKLEKKVATDCTQDYEGCEKEKNGGNCADACKKYKEYIGKKNVEYTNQEGKFNREKSESKPGYDGYYDKEASEYLEKECLNSSCSCMKNVTDNSDYWKKPHTTYDDNSLQKKCECELPPQDACTIVKDLFEDNNKNKTYFDQACSLKYSHGKEKHTQWKCINDTTSSRSDKETPTTSPTSTSTCIPPRRQKMYTKPIETLNKMSPLGLRTAFIQCAAVETFFAWHEYKEEKKKEEEEKKEETSYLVGRAIPAQDDTSIDKELQKKLEKGDIPEDFMRQMFYTFGDYRNICLGNDMGKDSAKDISVTVKRVLNSRKPSTPKEWWDSNANDIWEGMLCALSYDTNEKMFKQNVRTQLTSTDKKKMYDYNNIKISSVPSGDIKLAEFSKKPQFIRWFEEWSEEFCRKKKIKIDKIINECRSDRYGKRYCSADGHDCEKEQITSNEIFIDLHCRACEKVCIKYKKWIKNKEKEFDKQKKKCEEQIKQSKTSSKNYDDEELYNYLNKKGYSSVEIFLESLNKGKECQGNKDKNNEINFKNSDETFDASKYCTACPVYGVRYNRTKHKCEPIDEKEYKSTKGIREELEKDSHPTKIDVLVLGRKEKHKDNYLINSCKNIGFFEDTSVQNWECLKKNRINQCNLTNFAKYIDIDKDMSFNEFFQGWLRLFVHDYNKLKDEIDPCIKKEKEKDNKCIKGCNDKCKCVEEWLEIKKKEWINVKTHYEKGKKPNDYEIPYWVMSYFERDPLDSDYKKAQDVVESKDERERYKLWGCTGDNIENRDKKTCEDGDFITNLINKLKDKIQTCKENHNPSGKSGQTCETPHTPDENPDTHDETESTPEDSQSPKFCPQPPPPPPPMTCVERAAEDLRKQAERRVNKKLEGTGLELNGKCNNIKKENAPLNGENSCDLQKTYKNSMEFLKETCEGNGKERFNIANIWNCKYIKDIGKDFCIPPRRKDMCIKELNNIASYNINNSSDLLKKVQEAAQNEGNDIIRKLLEHNSCHVHGICDAMKYSFADLGDIIRGRDLLRNDSDQVRIQRKLENSFENIYNELGKDRNKYDEDRPKYLKLRSDWWDANRKHIWNAMSCNAPDDAKFLKKEENGSTTISSQVKCGHNSDPPDYDYIPQPFRWMQEWSEYYCKARINEIEKLQTECNECKTNASSCQEGDGKKCEKCKTKCKSFNDFVQQWQRQFNIQSQTYKELYDKAMKNNSDGTATPSNDKSVEGPRLPRRRGKPRAAQEDDSITIEFLKLVKHKCKDPNISEKYLDKANNCIQYTFAISSGGSGDNNYAFKNPPKEFEEACKCEPPDPLDQCPNNKENKGACQNLSIETECRKKNLNNDDDWSTQDVKDLKDTNKGVLVPPRRRHLCLRNITSNLSVIKTKEYFKKKLIQAAYSEAYFLSEIYNKDQEKALQAMKYSFADYGDIVKGTDMIENSNKKKLNTKLDELLNDATNNNPPAYREKWWEENKQHVWHAMVCGYQKGNNYKPINSLWCTVPHEDEKTHQFMRWFREWTESFCAQRKKLYDIMVAKCKEAECDKTTGRMSMYGCTQACREYENYVFKKKLEYFGQKEKYDNEFKALNDNKDAPYYFRSTFFSKNYDCLFDNFNGDNKWKNPYESFNNDEYKEKCECKQSVIPTERKEQKTDKDPEESPQKPVPDPGPSPEKSPPKSDVLPPSQSDESSIPMNDILSTTIPVGIALALGSIAFMFMKKKPKSPVDLLRVLDVHKGDYGTPTPKSSNRYIPYVSDTYKGRTYIYMEGDTSGDEKYAFMSDTTDITSSESEYEEMDINDIYVPDSPKYKTLIEVVLEPSKRDIPSNDIEPTDRFTDEEWNQLKHDFISQYVVREPLDIPQYDVSTELPMNIGGNVLDDGMEEKPFITSIHDRDLYTGEEISYNIDMGTNSMDDPKYVSNNVYSGIDLINDTLSGNQHIDIYDEVLKRKENELFGTNHTKNTSNNNVAKLTNNDPIMNQLDLLHKWLDRHRDMCEQWNTKEDILNKLNEQWNKDNDRGNVPNDNKKLNTDVSIQIDMDDPKGKKEFSNMDTILDNIEDDIYYDVNDDENPFVDHIPMDHNKVDVPKKVHVEMKILNNTFNGSLEQEFPISDVWNI